MALFGLFGDNTKAQLRKLEKIAEKIEALDGVVQGYSDEALHDKTDEFRNRLSGGKETLDDLLPEAFAVVREAAWRVLGQKPFHVQLLGGIVLHQGRIAEMKTGEGKTLTATLPAYLNALAGKGVHIVTVNEYLAGYQSEMMSKLFGFLGMTVGNIYSGMSTKEKQAAYACDITYGTNSEFGFDYLRDNMAMDAASCVQRELSFAIVDEVDSILIDEARTPLIISGMGEDSSEMYNKAHQIVCRFSGIQEKEKGGKLDLPDEEYEQERLKHDYTLDEKGRTVSLTETGVAKVEKALGIEDLSDPSNTELAHYINQALKANFLFKRDRDYVVTDDGQVKIVDEFTGRILEGRRYSEGLHQAIEAKEGVEVANENKTLATITYQNYFRMYRKLSGMTGTAKTEEEEFQGIYSLDVVCVPTNMPMIRKDLDDKIYATTKDKFNAVVEEVQRRHETGQPVLVGTVSVEISEIISGMLTHKGVKHNVLNAKHHAREAEIVAQAGRLGAVTIATNMAGRGTDILLGGNPDFMARSELKAQEYTDEAIELATGHQATDDADILALRNKYNELLKKYKQVTDKEHEQVVAVGGLCILGTERHESRRIDNQLRGRSGRQGDPGCSCFYISLEDDLIRIFAENLQSDRMKAMMSTATENGQAALQVPLLTRSIEAAQKKVESRNFASRKHVLQYDDVVNKQRKIIYEQRKKVFDGADISDSIHEMTRRVIERTVQAFTADQDSKAWNLNAVVDELKRICLPKEVSVDEIKGLEREEITDKLNEYALQRYDAHDREIREASAAMDTSGGNGITIKDLERMALLRTVTQHWMDHIDAVDQLKQGISLRSMAQRDPLQEFTMETGDMFNEMNLEIQEDAVRMVYNLSVASPKPVKAPKITAMGTQDNIKKPEKKKTTGVKVSKEPGRNDPCPCGSGKKYKNCCGMK